MEENPSIRIDKWLKIARFFKRREDASDAVDNGFVKLNDAKVKPSRLIKAGDVLTVKIDNRYRELTVKKILTRSVSAALAKEMYEMKEPFVKQSALSEYYEIFEAQEKENKKNWRRTKPNKKDRRLLNEFKYDSHSDED